MMSDGNFHIGDKVVYPNHGVGVIEQISSRTIGATVEKFYLLKIKASSLKVMVPFHNVNTVGLRRVVKNGEIQKIVDFLTDGDVRQQRRLEIPLQGKFRAHAHRFTAGSRRGSEESASADTSPSLSHFGKRRCSNAPATSWSAS